MLIIFLKRMQIYRISAGPFSANKTDRGAIFVEWNGLFTLTEIDEVARVFWESFPDKKIYAFKGIWVRVKPVLSGHLRSKERKRKPVGSPTFSIINEYSFSDWYYLSPGPVPIKRRGRSHTERVLRTVCIPEKSAWWNGRTGHPVYFQKRHWEFSSK